MDNEDITAQICSQLFDTDDLALEPALVAKVRQEGIATSILLERRAIRIVSQSPLILSNITPLLHDFGFMIIDELAYTLEEKGGVLYVCRFNLHLTETSDLARSSETIELIVSEFLKGAILLTCKMFSLAYHQNLSLREITLLRAMTEYLKQSLMSIGYDAIVQTLTTHHDLSHLFVEYFKIKFDPHVTRRAAQLRGLETRIEDKIKSVPDIMEDRILKLTFALLHNLTRTNYFFGRSSIAIKIDGKEFGKHLRGIQPHIEVFVFNDEFNGVHMRMGAISRGGLRWSERHDDYRQEIKSLMITQEGKNSIIVPRGAKGGFVIKKESSLVNKESFTRIYEEYIHNLLDLVDDMEGTQLRRDSRIVAYDSADTYFVVAADKGTADMSDVANKIALERGYWLGDAFASGGSNGFGHKELGITAKGALASTQRFFLEEGVDFYRDPITVVGIGSMNGDVFGNGLIASKSFRLLAAVSHKEIFVDPNPPEGAYDERLRLFHSRNGGWKHYNPQLISQGGGVYLRSDKAIELSPQIKKMVHTTKKTLSGEELAKKLLCMKVDLLFNGGVGTYVKSSDESDLELGDKQNEAVRVDASDLKARIVCEGGNLGFTQKARIEYALHGGKINLDGIDNAAGVNTSDHEVNLKIVLNTLVQKGILTSQQRQKALGDVTESTVNSVLWNNYAQSLAISRDEILSREYREEYIRSIEVLEQYIPTFKRRDFFIPKNENIEEIINKEGSMIRPILGSLLSYSKILLKQLLIGSELIDEPFAQQYLYKYFPKSVVGAYEPQINAHPLRREIIAMVIADTLINRQGVFFIADMRLLGEEKFLLKIKSWLMINQLFGANDIRHTIFRQDYAMGITKQYELLNEIENAINFSTHWMLRYLDEHHVEPFHILAHKEPLYKLLSQVSSRPLPALIEGNVSFNRFFGLIDYIRFSVAAIMIQEGSHHTFENVATLLFHVIDSFRIVPIINALDDLNLMRAEDRMLKEQASLFIEFVLVHYTRKILSFQRLHETPKTAIENYIESESELFHQMIKELQAFSFKEVKEIKPLLVIINRMMGSAL